MAAGQQIEFNLDKACSLLLSTKSNIVFSISRWRFKIINSWKWAARYPGYKILWCSGWLVHWNGKSESRLFLTKDHGLSAVWHAKLFLSRDHLKTLYTVIVDPHIRYCCSIWSCPGSTEIDQLQKLRDHAAGIVTNSNYDALRLFIGGLGWKTVEELIKIGLQVVFISRNCLALQYLHDLFTKKAHNSLPIALKW